MLSRSGLVLFALKTWVRSIHVLVLLLLSGLITWASLVMGLSYEQVTVIALSYLVLEEWVLPFRTTYTPASLLALLIDMPILLIFVLCSSHKDEQTLSAAEIGKAAIEKRRQLQKCTA
jgi:hypothetical protein